MVEKIIEQEKKFDILKNPAGELLIIIKARLTNESHPVIVYDGGEHALLYRNDENTVVLDFIHPQVRADLINKKRVLIVEAQGNSVIREYFSTVKAESKIEMPHIVLN